MRFDGLLVSINLTTEFLIISGECWPKRKGMFSAAIELCVAMLVKKKKRKLVLGLANRKHASGIRFSSMIMIFGVAGGRELVLLFTQAC